jgi:hypothetical protein
MLFIILSLLGGAMMYINSTGTGFAYLRNVPMTSYLSLGNLGYASIQCEITPKMAKTVFMNCPYANITRIVDDGFGISIAPKHEVEKKDDHFVAPTPRLCPAHKPVPVPEWDRNRCLRSVTSKHADSNETSRDESTDYLINDEDMDKLMKEKCYGKNNC